MRLAALSTHIPPDRIDTETIVAAAGRPRAEAQVFRRMFEMEHVAAVPEGGSLRQELDRILCGLQAEHAGALPDALIHVHGQPLQDPVALQAPITALRRDHPFLAGVTRCYDVDQHNCSGFFWALDLARTLLATRLAKTVVVVGGDSHIGLPLSDRYIPGCTLMGDAFCGMVLDAAPDGPQFGAITLHTHPEFAPGRGGTTAQMGAFFAAHGTMVAKALSQSDFDWTGQGALLPHNVNSLAWRSFAQEFGVDPGRIRLDLLPDVGHCYISDPFLLLDAERKRDPDLTGAPTLLSVGMGGFVGAARLFPAPAAPASSRDIHPSKETLSCMQLLDC